MDGSCFDINFNVYPYGSPTDKAPVGRGRVLRFAGFIVGAGIIGWGTEVFILPQLNTIAEYALLFASVVWIGAWVATSGPRIAFIGLQIVLSYSLVSLNRFTINTSLVPARDVVLGVVLGVVAMWLVFDHLWAQTSSASVRALLLGTLRSVANFKATSAEYSVEENQRWTAESSKINLNSTSCEISRTCTLSNPFLKAYESLVNRSIRMLLPELRAFLLVKTGLVQHRTLASEKLGEMLIHDVDESASNALHRLANAIEKESAEELSSWNSHIDKVREQVSIEGGNS